MSGQFWSDQVRSCQVKSRLSHTAQVETSLVRSCQVRSCQVSIVQVRSGPISPNSGQLRLELVGKIHNNVVLGQVKTRSKHIWSSQVRSGQYKSTSCQVSQCLACQVKIKASQIR